MCPTQRSLVLKIDGGPFEYKWVLVGIILSNPYNLIQLKDTDKNPNLHYATYMAVLPPSLSSINSRECLTLKDVHSIFAVVKKEFWSISRRCIGLKKRWDATTMCLAILLEAYFLLYFIGLPDILLFNGGKGGMKSIIGHMLLPFILRNRYL